MKTPAVSVVISTYNYGRFLAGALESVLGQTFQDFEVVIVDDGSTDETPSVVQPFLADPRVRYRRQRHAGQPQAKNLGIALARAPLIAFLDADDIWLPEKLERQVQLFRNDPELGVVYSRRLLINEEGWELEYRQPPLHRGRVLAQIFLCNFVCFSSSVVSREALERCGGFDENLALAIDYDLWLRIAQQYRFDYVDEPLVLYRTGHASLSRRRRERVETVGHIMKRFLDSGGRELLDAEQVRLAEADYFCDKAAALHEGPRTTALACYARALTIRPLHGPAWRGLLSGWWPEAVRGMVRRALGRPDWRTRRAIGPPPFAFLAPAALPPRSERPSDLVFSSREAGPPDVEPVESKPPEPATRPSLLTSVAANWVGFAAQMLAAFFLSPLLVHGLGDERYGIWALLDSVIAYFTLFDLGVAASVVRYVARFEAVRDDDRLNRVFSTSLSIFGAAGLAVLVLTAGVAFGGLSLLHVPEALVTEARPALLLLGLNLAVGLPLSVFPAVLDGLGRYPTKTGVRTVGLVLRCFLVYLLTRHGGGLVELAGLALVFSVAEHGAMAMAARHYLPQLRFSPRLVDRDTFHTIRGYSLDAFVAMVAGRISFQTDALVIGRFLAPSFITFFALAARLVEYSKDSLRVATAVLTPAISALDARGDQGGIRTVLLTSTRYALWLILPAQLGLLLLGRPFLTLWLGPDYADRSYPVLAILAAPLALAVSQSVSARVLYGSGRLRWFSRVALTEALANLVLSVALVGPLGIEGVALGTALPNLVANCAVARYVCRGLDVSLFTYLRRSFLAPGVAALLLGGGWWWALQWHAPSGWGGLAAMALGGTGTYFLVGLLAEWGPRKVWQALRRSRRN